MINKYTLKHLLHQPEKIIKVVNPNAYKIPKTKILPFPQITNNNHKGDLVNNRTIKFVVHKPNQNNSCPYTQKENVLDTSQTNSHRLNTGEIKISTGPIRETFASVKTKWNNYFNEKAS